MAFPSLAPPWLRALRIAADWHLSTTSTADEETKTDQQHDADLNTLLHELSTIASALTTQDGSHSYFHDHHAASSSDDLYSSALPGDVDRRSVKTADIILDPSDEPGTNKLRRGYTVHVVQPLRRRAAIRKRNCHHRISASLSTLDDNSMVEGTSIYATLPMTGKQRRRSSLRRSGSLNHYPARRYPVPCAPPRLDSMHGVVERSVNGH